MIKGHIDPNFSNVASLFEKLIPRSGNGGAALCVYHCGKPVVDIWGGTKNEMGDRWEEDTLALSFSTTKGIASTLLHILADRGLIKYDAPIATYWHEFGQEGKHDITVRHLLCHESGMYDIHRLLDHSSQLNNWDTVINKIETSRASHRPGLANGYHALTYGYLVGELVSRVTGKPFAQVLKEELTDPLGLDGMFVGLPDDELHRRSTLISHQVPEAASSGKPKSLQSLILKQVIAGAIRLSGANPNNIRAGLLPRGMSAFDFNSRETVQSCIPSMNGMFTARSLAAVYNMLANQGEGNGQKILSGATIREASTIQNMRRDKVVPIPMRWRLGYHRVFTTGPKTPHAFGHFGYGGSGAWCDPSRQLSVAMTLNSGIGTPFGDSRLARINGVVIRSAEKLAEKKSAVLGYN